MLASATAPSPRTCSSLHGAEVWGALTSVQVSTARHMTVLSSLHADKRMLLRYLFLHHICVSPAYHAQPHTLCTNSPCAVASLVSTSLMWPDPTAPHLRLLQLLLPTCIRVSYCSPFATASAAAHLLQLLLLICVCFNCYSQIVSASATAPWLHSLQLLLPICVRFSCCSSIASACDSIVWEVRSLYGWVPLPGVWLPLGAYERRLNNCFPCWCVSGVENILSQE